MVLAGGGGVEVVEDHQYGVLAVVHRVRHTVGETVVPEAAVAHHRHHALAEQRRHRAR